MKVTVDNIVYETVYYPFFRTEKHDDFTVYGIRYPSGKIEELLVFDHTDDRPELIEHLKFLVSQYGLADDETLTLKARELKADVKALFGID